MLVFSPIVVRTVKHFGRSLRLALSLGNEAEDSTMRTSRFTQKQVAMALRQVESGTPVAEICRKLQVTEQTFYRRMTKLGSMGTPEIHDPCGRQERNTGEMRRRARQRITDPRKTACYLTPPIVSDLVKLGLRGFW
jgi:putative transposase